MPLYRWPTDPPGKPPAHSIPYNVHQQHTTAAARPPAAAAPAAPSAVGGVAPGPLPPDPLYDAQLNNLAVNRDNAVGAATGSRARTLADYGYNESGPPGASGAGTLTFDPHNPFSKAAQLKRLYDTSRRSTGQQMGSTGGLYAGSYQNAQDAVNRGQIGAQDQMQKGLLAFLAQNTAAKTQAQTGYIAQAQVAGGERAARIESNPLYEPTVGSTAAKSTPKAAPKAKAKPTPAQAAAAAARQRATQSAAAAAAEARAKARARKRKRR